MIRSAKRSIIIFYLKISFYGQIFYIFRLIKLPYYFLQYNFVILQLVKLNFSWIIFIIALYLAVIYKNVCCTKLVFWDLAGIYWLKIFTFGLMYVYIIIKLTNKRFRFLFWWYLLTRIVLNGNMLFVDVGAKPKAPTTPAGPLDEKIFPNAPEGSGIYF